MSEEKNEDYSVFTALIGLAILGILVYVYFIKEPTPQPQVQQIPQRPIVVEVKRDWTDDYVSEIMKPSK
jgi:hypothetical protein